MGEQNPLRGSTSETEHAETELRLSREERLKRCGRCNWGDEVGNGCAEPAGHDGHCSNAVADAIRAAYDAGYDEGEENTRDELEDAERAVHIVDALSTVLSFATGVVLGARDTLRGRS